MNQLFNTVNYFEFQAFEALPAWKAPGVYTHKPESHAISWKQKSRRGIPAPGGFWLIV
jgi:hypothetical protein